MALSNTATRYGSVTKTFHWLTALLIFTVIPLGVVAYNLPYDTSEQLAFKAQLFSLHKTVGIAIFATALARILWALTQPKPGLLNADKRAESFLAALVHWLLYGSLVLVPLTGWIHHAATTGFAPIWWPLGQDLPFVPKDEGVAQTFAALHKIFERVMVAALLLHIIGALKHHLIDRDDTLRRMLPGRTEAAGGAHRTTGPLGAAVVVWAGALVLGGALGLFAPKETVAEAVQLEEVSSDWTVEDGEIALTVTQFGAPVTGRFEDWTAAITYDADGGPGFAGSVTTQIAIGSLTLGSVTGQALGSDFFDAGAYPTATYTGEIFRIVDGHEVRGTLTLKDTEVPVTFPFDLRIDDTGRATMEGAVTLNRLDFGIGANMPDESSLLFAVDVAIRLTAQRTSGQRGE